MSDANYEISGFWQSYLNTLPPGSPQPSSYRVWHFGNSREMANKLALLAKMGHKTATCSLLWEHELSGETLPQPGELSVITDWEGRPVCIIETTEVEIRPYNEIDEQFARDEGEGDRSLAHWHEHHWQFFSKICESLGRQSSPTMPLVCERFRLIYS